MNQPLDENDAPLFQNEDYKSANELELEKIRRDDRKFNQLIGLGSKSIKWIVLTTGFLIVLDGVYQKLGIDNGLIKEVFSLVKYSLTTILGFIFAGGSNQSS